MKRSWVPVKPTPKIGKRVTHTLFMADPVEAKPLAELNINSKIVKPLEAVGIVTIHDLAEASSVTIAGVKQVSVKTINSFRRYCQSRGIKVRMTVSAVSKIRHRAKMDVEQTAQDLKLRQARRTDKLRRRNKKAQSPPSTPQ